MHLFIALAVIGVLFGLGWVFMPQGWLTRVMATVQGVVIALLPVLDYMAIFNWQTILPPGQAAVAAMVWNVLLILAKDRQKIVGA